MISFIRGTLSSVSDGKIEVDTGMMGFEISVPVTVIDMLPAIGGEVKIFTHMNVKEDEISLYGFESRDSLEMFRMLITVSGIGPKGALQILSAFTPQDLRFAILAGDAKAISKAQGVGAKTAQRLCMELKDKVSIEDSLEHYGENGSAKPVRAEESSEKNDAVLALTALGYGSTEVMKAVAKIDVNGKTSEMIIKEALRYLY